MECRFGVFIVQEDCTKLHWGIEEEEATGGLYRRVSGMWDSGSEVYDCRRTVVGPEGYECAIARLVM